MRVAVVGHVEWLDFVRVEHLPRSGEIIYAVEAWEEPAGGGAVAAVQLRKLAGAAAFFTAVGHDELGARAREGLQALGVDVRAAVRDAPQRRAVCFVEATGERTITLLSPKLHPYGRDPLPWALLSDVDGVYFTGGDVDALREARRARVLVATARELPTLARASVQLDALVRSATDLGEEYRPGVIEPAPKLVVATAGDEGGTFQLAGGAEQHFDAAPLPGPIADSYGAGDSFAAALTFALAGGRAVDDAIAFAARCGAASMTGRGAYEGQLQR